MWLEKDGAILGDGLFNLLLNVERLGSISQAARFMSMSYRSAWGKIKITEKQWGVPLVNTRVGGKTGGGAALTPQAKDLLKRYYKFRQEIDNFVWNIYDDIFKGWPGP